MRMYTRKTVQKESLLFLSLLALALSSGSSKVLVKKKFPFTNYLLNPCSITDIVADRGSAYTEAHTRIYEDIKGATRLALIVAQKLEAIVDSSECNGLSLETLAPVPDFSDPRLKETLKITYKAVFNYLTHVYFLTYECTTSAYYCKNGTLSNELRRLAGKLQYLLCNILLASSDPFTRTQSIIEIRNNRMICYNSCSAKELQQCLVITGTVELLKTLTSRLEATPLPRKNSLHPTFLT